MSKRFFYVESILFFVHNFDSSSIILKCHGNQIDYHNEGPRGSIMTFLVAANVWMQ